MIKFYVLLFLCNANGGYGIWDFLGIKLGFMKFIFLWRSQVLLLQQEILKEWWKRKEKPGMNVSLLLANASNVFPDTLNPFADFFIFAT